MRIKKLSRRPLKALAPEVTTADSNPSGTQMTLLGHAVAGSMGSALALLLLYPLERVRLELQSSAGDDKEDSTTSPPSGNRQRKESDIKSPAKITDEWVACRSSASSTDSDDFAMPYLPSSTEHHKGKRNEILSCLRKLYERGDLYRGAAPVIITLATSNFVFFYGHQAAKRLLLPPVSNRRATARSLLASTLAGIINVMVTNPLWVANLRIVKGSSSSPSLWITIRDIFRSEGLASLWNGTMVSLLLVSNPVIQFFTYEQMKAIRLSSISRKTLSASEAFALGAIAKAIATVVTYPLQLTQVLLRLEQQKEKVDAASRPLAEPRYRGTWDCFVKLYKEGGTHSLFKGMNAKLIQTVLTAAFTFLTYEQILSTVQATAIYLQRAKRQSRLKT
jgi:adenine nucleotide transporter 17